MALQSLTVGRARFRAGSWRGRTDLAYLVPLSAAHTLDEAALAAVRDQLRDRGFAEVVTAAVATAERDAFLNADYTDHEHLHLLRYDLPRLPRSARRGQRYARIVRGRRRDWPAVLELDCVAFDDFWQLDRDGLDDSLQATTYSRLRIVRGGPADLADAVVGYAVAGRAGSQGYLQRLAVAPGRQGRGLGSALVFDAMHWMRRRGATVAWVNTQERNDRALGLYEHLGFRLQPDQLTVLRRTLK